MKGKPRGAFEVACSIQRWPGWGLAPIHIHVIIRVEFVVEVIGSSEVTVTHGNYPGNEKKRRELGMGREWTEGK